MHYMYYTKLTVTNKGLTMNTFQQIVIMSVSKQVSDLTDIESTNDFDMYLKSNKFSFNQAMSCYQGNKERSFVILINDDLELELLKAVAMKYNKESILFQDSNGISQLLFTDGSNQVAILGKLREVDNKEALSKDDYTILKGKYYSIID